MPPRPASLVDLLPRQERNRLQPLLRRVSLELGQIVAVPGEPIEAAYFPIDCIVSVIAVTEAGESVEAGLVGCEGVSGLPLFLGQEISAHRYQCQVPGEAWRMRAAHFVRESAHPGPLHDLLLRYTHAFITLVAQSALCNGRHTLEQRCARWLLTTHDRVGRDSFPLTHEFLATMLGVRRAGVTVALGALQRAGAVAYHRGQITIADRACLEAASCPCHAITARQFARLADGVPARA